MDQNTPTSDPAADWKRGLKTSFPVLLGITPFALVLGAQATTKGLSLVEVPLMAGLNFGGGSELAAVALWTSPPHIVLILVITFLINSRHLLMGAAFAPLITHVSPGRALGLLFLMCDESWALAMVDARRSNRRVSVPFYLAASFSVYAVWVGFTTIGALIGPFLGDVKTYGFDMAIPAVYLVMLAGFWKGISRAIPWFVSLAVAALAYLYLPQGWHIPAGAIAGLIASFVMSSHV